MKGPSKMSDSLTTTTTPISRSEEEILNAFKEASSAMFGFAAEDYLVALPFASAKPYLKDDVTEEDWKMVATRTRESVLAKMKEYASFAWSKVTGHRGISAGRNLDHYRAWCWLLGDEESVALLDAEGGYAPYGAPKLAFVCKKYDLFIPDSDEARRMSEGKPCCDICSYGCNS